MNRNGAALPNYVNRFNNAITNAANVAANVATNAANNGVNVLNNFFKSGNNVNKVATATVMNADMSKIPWGLILIGALLVTIIILIAVFYDKIRKAIADLTGEAGAVTVPAEDAKGEKQSSELQQQATAVVNAIIPGHKEVFHVMDNKYAYEDSEPLCKALGAELATYEQVKDAWKKGADWCSYGWVKGQSAVFPTSEATWQKLQQGPADQKNACGLPGLNGGYFDNADLRFGVNCYGEKPVQGAADAAAIAKGSMIPKTPEVIEYERKVAKFRSEKYNTAVAPFNDNLWSN
jgi:hypothetical protein